MSYDETTTQTSTSNDYATDEPPLYVSPLIETLPMDERPAISPACETCPSAVWYKTKKRLACYCKSMSLIVWDKDALPILKCDGRERALMKLEAQQDA